ncbi:MAG: bifunctional phosphopantothenoylcysteine decarboxylase/phosphopantothenate--cysteine ligase CoaBC [Candidatus Cloacimonetes bacterium]|nr:bifunctional phosphopantothenoylcysteine decarboxylase/phosphopantothenate--cysteine ligase CoaBC [Candidatus Cloacimonadota bacterium]
MILKNKKIILGVTGGIAAYKSIELASLLKKKGAQVKVVMTKSAMEFVSPLTFRSITQETVSHLLFNNDSPIEHISLSDWADLLVIAPATGNMIGKIANGIADDLLSTVVMASTCPKLIVPAMNVNMLENPITQANIIKLKELNYWILKPATGRLACGYEAKGRLPEPSEIQYAIKNIFLSIDNHLDFKGKKVLITAGASIEKLDPMRFISNVSSGKMGINLAKSAFLRGAEVTLIHSNVSETLPYYTTNIEALSAEEMYKETLKIAKDFDIIIMCAAVADFTPETYQTQKIKKSNTDKISIQLLKTKDILTELSKLKLSNQKLIGFAAETQNIEEYAKQKLITKNLDMIIANNLETASKSDTQITIIGKNFSNQFTGDKHLIANIILDYIKKC